MLKQLALMSHNHVFNIRIYTTLICNKFILALKTHNKNNNTLRKFTFSHRKMKVTNDTPITKLKLGQK